MTISQARAAVSTSQSAHRCCENAIVADNYRGTGTNVEDDIANGSAGSASSFNLIGTGGSGGLTNGVNNNHLGVANPGLSPLANNGGPTQTHAFQTGSPPLTKATTSASPQISAAPRAPYNDPAITNASGGDGSDIGAFERQPGNAMSTATSVGSNVAVQLGPVSVTFAGVSAAGTTSQISIDPTTAGALPGGYSLGPGLLCI